MSGPDDYSDGPKLNSCFVSNQEDLNKLFRSLNLSFDDPNRIADVLEEVSVGYRRGKQQLDNSLTKQEWSDAQGQTDLLYDFLDEIRGLQFHRHRVDAANIIEEVNHRLSDPSYPRRIDPNPMCFSSTPSLPRGYDLRHPSERQKLLDVMATRDAGDPPPLPEYLQSPPLDSIPQERVLPAENIGLSYWVEQPRDGFHWMRLLQLKAVENPGTPIPEYLDNPTDQLLNYPDHFPLIDGPVPEVVQWREEDLRRPEVYDLRKDVGRYVGRENEDSYLYKFFCLIQNVLLQPEVAMKYTIILRATRSRYLDSGPDNIWGEPAPTSTEVQQLLNWFATGFPTVLIGRNGDRDLNGLHDRLLGREKIELSGEQFDLIEQGQRENKPIAHRFYLMYCTIFHEVGHYLNTHINAPFRKEFLTPRKLRWYIHPAQQGEDSEDPAHAGFYIPAEHIGEMGQIIELLVFGHMIRYLTIDPNARIAVDVRGSSFDPYGDNRAQIVVPHEILKHMFCARVPLRMNGQALRGLIRGLEITKQENENGHSREALLGNLRIDKDAIAAGQEIPGGYGGYRYRQAIRRIQRDLLEMAYGIEESHLTQEGEKYYC